METSYFPKEFAQIVGLAESTIRKYAIEFQKQGYQFEIGRNKSRIYKNEHVVMFNRLKQALNQPDVSLETAVNSVLSMVSEDDKSVAVIEESFQDSVMERFDRLEKALVKQQEYINESLDRRDEQLMKVLREIQEFKELKKEILEVKEAQLLIASTSKKHWWQFWK